MRVAAPNHRRSVRTFPMPPSAIRFSLKIAMAAKKFWRSGLLRRKCWLLDCYCSISLQNYLFALIVMVLAFRMYRIFVKCDAILFDIALQAS